MCSEVVSAILNITHAKKLLMDDKYRAFFAFLIVMAMVSACTVWPDGPGRYGYSSNASGFKSRGHIIYAEAISQYPELPSGCEPTSAAMLLNWAGVNITKEDAARAIPKGALPAMKNGVMRGSSPDKVFIGDPFSNNGFGAYHEVIAKLINKYLPGQADDVSGTSFENILGIIDSGRPVIVWSTIALSKPCTTITWYDESNKKMEWKSPEHAYLLVGYDEDNNVYADDPDSGMRRSYPLSLFKKRWEQMGRQAVTISQSEQSNKGAACSSNSCSGKFEPDTLQYMDFAGKGINLRNIIKNVNPVIAGFKNAIYSCYIGIRNIHIISKLRSAAESLYEGIIYIADNM